MLPCKVFGKPFGWMPFANYVVNITIIEGGRCKGCSF